MKTIHQFLFLTVLFFVSNAVYANSPIVNPNVGGPVEIAEDQIKVTLCISGSNWEVCITFESSIAVSNTSLKGVGTLNDENKTLTVTGLPKELRGKELTISQNVSFSRADSVKAKTTLNKITLKRGLVKVDENGSFTMPYSTGK